MSRFAEKPWLPPVAFLLAGASAAAVAFLMFFVFVIQPHSESKQLKDAICDTFTDVASSPISPQMTPLGRKLITDTAHGARVAHCPQLVR